MSRVLRRLTTTDVDTAVPMAGPAKAMRRSRHLVSLNSQSATLQRLHQRLHPRRHEDIWELRGETSWRGTYVSPHNRSAAG